MNDNAPMDQSDQATAYEMLQVMEVLEQIAEDRALLAELTKEDRIRLIRAAGRVAAPDRTAREKLGREKRRRAKLRTDAAKAADERLLAATGIRAPLSNRQLKKSHAPAPTALPPAPARIRQAEPATGPRLQIPRSCYICKQDFREVHFFYDAMCPGCAEFNWERRNQSADLSSRVALVTGGRVKIGYQAALKLLRAGATTIITTRFPRDAAARFTAEDDHRDWADRIHVHGIDLRHTPSVEAFAQHLVETLPRLDFILNNACQTVRRPPGFYAHLMDAEQQLAESTPDKSRPLLESYEALRRNGFDERPADAPPLPVQVEDSLAGIRRAAELSQIPLVDGDRNHGPDIFPAGRLDADLQQVDLRPINSWRLRLADVPTVELLEVQLVNAIAPFILNARLKPLMTRVPTRDKHIVNVSAMEGVFYRAYKTDKHPHTNMAKAALNMLTRTSARDYVADGIHMNSVDTGWITDEDPAQIAERKREELGFYPPLDLVDAAARICDPIFQGLLTGKHVWGVFLKDYQVANW